MQHDCYLDKQLNNKPVTKYRKLLLLSLYQAVEVLASVASPMSKTPENRQLHLVLMKLCIVHFTILLSLHDTKMTMLLSQNTSTIVVGNNSVFKTLMVFSCKQKVQTR